MKRFLPLIITFLVLGTAWAYGNVGPQENPDPNHTHADFAVWVGSTELNFSAPEYMSGVSTDESTHPHEGLRQFFHLHDGVGHVMHRHKPGLTIGDFFTSLGLTMTETCFTLDQHQFELLDPAWVSDFAISKDVCTNGKFRWTMVLNGQVVAMNPTYVFNDEDQILLSYESSDTAWQEQWKEMTDDACKYSQTCPWKGEPPAENCIADPTVPCVE